MVGFCGFTHWDFSWEEEVNDLFTNKHEEDLAEVIEKDKQCNCWEEGDVEVADDEEEDVNEGEDDAILDWLAEEKHSLDGLDVALVLV